MPPADDAQELAVCRAALAAIGDALDLTPLILIANAESDKESYADILVRLLKKRLAQAPDAAVEGVVVDVGNGDAVDQTSLWAKLARPLPSGTRVRVVRLPSPEGEG